MEFKFDAVYYEPKIFEYELGKKLKEKYSNLSWFEIKNHNNIPEFHSASNKEFVKLKRHLIIGTRKTHKYTENHKSSDYLVPYTSSGCFAMCLYCYLVCNYNKCAYLRLFVNREEMLERLIKRSLKEESKTFEIGSNSDLVLENTITDNLTWTIESFVKTGKGKITFPTKFHMIEPLLSLNHQGKVVFRMSVNPQEIINKIELGTSKLEERIKAVNMMYEAGYLIGILIAPIILIDNWEKIYSELIDELSEKLHPGIRKTGFIEIILMTYSYVQNAINTEAFSNALNLYDKDLMTGRGMGKYSYRPQVRSKAEDFLKKKLSQSGLKNMKILYIS